MSTEDMLKEEKKVNDEMKRLLAKAQEIERKKKGFDPKKPDEEEIADIVNKIGDREKIVLKDTDGKMKFIEVPVQPKKETNTKKKYNRNRNRSRSSSPAN